MTSHGSEMVEVISPRLLSVVVSAVERGQLGTRTLQRRKLTGDDDLLRQLETLPSKRRDSSSDNVDPDVGRCCREKVADRVERCCEHDPLGSTEHI